MLAILPSVNLGRTFTCELIGFPVEDDSLTMLSSMTSCNLYKQHNQTVNEDFWVTKLVHSIFSFESLYMWLRE